MFSEIKNRAGFKRYFANTSWLLAEKILRTAVLFLVWIFVIRYLGAERFGLLTYSLSFVGLFAAISALTADGILERNTIMRSISSRITRFLKNAIGIYGIADSRRQSK